MLVCDRLWLFECDMDIEDIHRSNIWLETTAKDRRTLTLALMALSTPVMTTMLSRITGARQEVLYYHVLGQGPGSSHFPDSRLATSRRRSPSLLSPLEREKPSAAFNVVVERALLDLRM